MVLHNQEFYFFFKHSLNLSTHILALAIRLVSITSFFVNASLFPKKGGINIALCFVSKRCCIVNPLSTTKASPGFVVIFHIDQIYLHPLRCLQINQTKHAAPFGFSYSNKAFPCTMIFIWWIPKDFHVGFSFMAFHI